MKESCIIALLLFSVVFGQVKNRSGQDSTIYISGKVFVPKYSFQSGEQNWGVAVADMNQDGSIDILTAGKQDGQVHIHFNDGSGNFGRRRSYGAQNQNRALCVFDANGDSWPDVATVTLLGKLCILLNDGQGGLKKPYVTQTGVMAHDVKAADINGDGFEELITAVVSENAFKIHWGSETGRFTKITVIPTGNKPRVLSIGDLNQDGKPDVAVGADDGRVHLHFGKGDMFFENKQSVRAGAAVWGLGLEDLNQDGLLDIVSASYMDKKLCVHLADGPGSYGPERCVLSGDHNFDLVIDDFDMDGDPDIVTCSTLDNAIRFHLNDGTGQIGEGEQMDSGNWNAGVAAADFDGDGDPDVVSASINDHAINVHRNISISDKVDGPVRYCVNGKVYDGDKNELLPNVAISLLNEAGESLDARMTASTGFYEFCPKAGQTYTLVVRSPNAPVYHTSFDMPEADLEKDIYLTRPKTAFVYGRVRDEESNRVLKKANLSFYANGGVFLDSIQTDEKGSYRYELPFGLNYSVSASYPEYERAELYFDLDNSHVANGLRRDLYLGIPAPARACIKGEIRDAQTQELVPDAKVIVRNQLGVAVKKFKARENGSYRICLDPGAYEFSTMAPGYFFNLSEAELNEEDIRPDQDKVHDIFLMPLKEGASIVLENIYYDVDKASLRDESTAELDRLVQIMTENPSLVVEIAGHTDSDASNEYNLNLSQARAESVVQYLMNAGIEAIRMQAQGYGEDQPVAPNNSRENKQLNRRTEFKVIEHQ